MITASDGATEPNNINIRINILPGKRNRANAKPSIELMSTTMITTADVTTKLVVVNIKKFMSDHTNL